MQAVLRDFDGRASDAAIGLARLPLDIRGFGPVKDAAAQTAAKQREVYLAALRSGARDLAAE